MFALMFVGVFLAGCYGEECTVGQASWHQPGMYQAMPLGQVDIFWFQVEGDWKTGTTDLYPAPVTRIAFNANETDLVHFQIRATHSLSPAEARQVIEDTYRRASLDLQLPQGIGFEWRDC